MKNQFFLLLSFFTSYCYSQTVPENLQADGYERHTEIRWDKLPTSHTVEIHRSEFNTNNFEKVGDSQDGIYIDFTGNAGRNKNWVYKLRSKDSSSYISNFSASVKVETRDMSDNEILDMIQKYTFRYFWDFAHPTSGLIYESNTSVSSHTTTSGGSGFGIMAIPVGIERGFITRQQGRDRILKIVNFLMNDDTDRFHGAWSHWINGDTGSVIPFSVVDDGADLVETALLVQGLLTVKEYFDQSNAPEIEIRTKIQTLWEGVQWDYFKREDTDYLTWHWSPNHGWDKGLGIQGWNEGMITYILGIASPTHSISPSLYHTGWARNGDFKSGEMYNGITLPLGTDNGGPLFLTHYSFLGLDPTKIGDKYIDSYFEQGMAQTLINRAYCINNPGNYTGYSENCWGLTASSSPPPVGYKAHEPSVEGDNGTIAPTAAISSMPYTPEESISALKYFYREHGEDIWGPMGFYDAFNLSQDWVSESYLAIDQGPIILMIENYRTKLLWRNFMKNQEVINGIESIPSVPPIDYDYDRVNENTVKVFINNEKELEFDITNPGTLSTMDAVIGDELTIEVHNIGHIPLIEGLPDVWIARAFINEGIFMSSKSIKPGAYRPWIPFSTVSHSTLVLPYNRDWFSKDGAYQPNSYPNWKKVGDKYRLRWTLQRTMDANLQHGGNTIDYTDKYADEEAPWLQTWDENGDPIVDGTGKFNKDGSVPHGEHPKPDGTYPQRQGKNMGMDMFTLNALKGTLKTAYGANTNFSDGSPYYVKSDNDDTYTTEFKNLSTEPYDVVTPTAELYRPFTEVWKVIPDGEMNNPVSEIVTWYQKAIHGYDASVDDLRSDYIYDGYEIWENNNVNSNSKAPGRIKLTSQGSNAWLTLNVQSPLEDDKFYTLYKANDNDNVRDLIVSTNELTVGMDKQVKTSLVSQMQSDESKFDLIFGYSTWDPQYTVKPLILNNNGTLSGDKTLDLKKTGPGPALHAFLTFRRTPESEPVIISGVDFWISSDIEAVGCEEYRNESESRSLRKSDFEINALSGNNSIDVHKHIELGYPLSKVNEEYTIVEGESLSFKIWNNVDFSFKQLDTKWYMSSRKRDQQLEEIDGAKRVKITLYKVADNSSLINTEVLQDFNEGTSLTHSHTFTSKGNYIYEASVERDNSGYSVFVKVLEPNNYKTNEEGRVKTRDLSPEEVAYINDVLDQDINGNDYKLAMVSDVKASYAWKQPKNGGGPRSFMKSNNNEAKFIDRFAPYNDYADHYVYQINDESNKRSTQNISAIQDYVTTKDPTYTMLPGIWVNHLDPLGGGTKHGIQDEFNLGTRIQDVGSTFIGSAFEQVQNTYAAHYMVDGINSRSPRPWELRLPWGSLSKYHGFRLRTAPKSPVNADELEQAILKIGKKGGGYFSSTSGYYGSGSYYGSGGFVGSGFIGSGGIAGGSNIINPIIRHVNGLMDTDEQRLEYRFFLNLKHNRWVVVPNTVDKITFFHGSDTSNQIASYDESTDEEASSASIPLYHDTKHSTVLSYGAKVGIGVGVTAAVGTAAAGVFYGLRSMRGGCSRGRGGYIRLEDLRRPPLHPHID